MSNTIDAPTTPDTSLKGKDFDEVCQLVDADPEAKCYVFKKPDTAGKWFFCFSFQPGEYDELETLEKIVVEFGPGEYPVQIKTKQENGQPKILWQKNMQVQAPRRGTVNVAPAAPLPAPGAGLDALAAAMENQTRLLAAVLEKVSQPAPVQVQQSREEFAKEMIAMKELFADNRPSGMESFREMLELQKLMVDASGGDSDPLTQAIKTLGPQIVEGVKKMNEADQRMRPERQQPHAAPAALPRASDAGTQPTFAHIDVEGAYSIFAEKYLSKLLAIPDEAEPEDLGRYVARLVGDNDQLLHVVGLVIQQDDMIDRLAKFDERVMQRAEWLDAIADWLAYALWPDANPAPEPENATIHATSGGISDSRGINGATAEGNGQDATDDDGLENQDDATGNGAPRGQLDNDP